MTENAGPENEGPRFDGYHDPAVEGYKGSPYSTAERRVPELIPVLGSRPAGDVSHKHGGRLPLLFATPAASAVRLLAYGAF